MDNRRTLSLRREQLGQLSDGELTAVAGASGIVCDILSWIAGPKVTDLCPTWDCTGCYLTCGC
jgi:hypothetical protein